ncbi:uncharacterized protein PRCAT00002227001 [Priceomyces carsonii]|uniref:uncharacterized protein n=1 Tax=Priceomyces carsonii TaxID=28549 RepID=UPI002ED8614B|nr:unnamed protein product [Priceomyces carsonii]
MEKIKEQNYYKHGFEKSVSDTHNWRNVDNSVKFIVPYLKQDFKVLDVGSGPGTITIDMGKYISKGSVIGVEPIEELIKEAKDNQTKSGVSNVAFQAGSIYHLPFEDNTFDLVFCHQVLIHLQDPLAGLKEMKRVAKPGGFVCAREGDLLASVVYPPHYEDTLKQYFMQSVRLLGSNATQGRALKSLAIDAGFHLSSISSGSSNWCIADDSSRLLWGTSFINRIQKSSQRVDEDDQKDEKMKKEIILDWKNFIEDERAWLMFPSGEIVCKK